jgi:hypothetical protein
MSEVNESMALEVSSRSPHVSLQLLGVKSHLLGMEEDLQRLAKKEGSTVRV